MRTFEKLKLTPEQAADLIDINEEMDRARGSAVAVVAAQMPFGVPTVLRIVISDSLGTLETGVLAAVIDTDWKAVTEILDQRHPEVRGSRDRAVEEYHKTRAARNGEPAADEVLN